MRQTDTIQPDEKNIVVLTLGIIAFICLALLSGPAFAVGKTEVRDIIIEEARQTVVPPSLALAVAKVESGFRDDFEGKDGARGVMQILPEVAEDQHRIDGEDLWDARQNVRLGLKILQRLVDRSDGDWDEALAKYSSHNTKGLSTKTSKKYVGDVLKWERTYADELIAQNEVEGRRREVLLGDASAFTPRRNLRSSRKSSRRYSSRRGRKNACADVDHYESDVDTIHDCLDSSDDGRFYTDGRYRRLPKYASRQYASRRYNSRRYNSSGRGIRYAWYRGPRRDLSGNIAERLRNARQYLDDFGDDYRPRRHRRGRVRSWR
jgi:hypothetical protein